MNAESGKYTYFKKEGNLLLALKWSVQKGLKLNPTRNQGRNDLSHTENLESLRRELSKCTLEANSTLTLPKRMVTQCSALPRAMVSQHPSNSQAALPFPCRLYPSLEEHVAVSVCKYNKKSKSSAVQGEYTRRFLHMLASHHTHGPR